VQAVQRGTIQLVYVPATRSVHEQVTALLKGRLWQAAKWSDEFRNSSADGRYGFGRAGRFSHVSYLDHAVKHRQAEGRFNGDTDAMSAVEEGALLRVRPEAMDASATTDVTEGITILSIMRWAQSYHLFVLGLLLRHPVVKQSDAARTDVA
jgi:hypothetical protein